MQVIRYVILILGLPVQWGQKRQKWDPPVLLTKELPGWRQKGNSYLHQPNLYYFFNKNEFSSSKSGYFYVFWMIFLLQNYEKSLKTKKKNVLPGVSTNVTKLNFFCLEVDISVERYSTKPKKVQRHFINFSKSFQLFFWRCRENVL